MTTAPADRASCAAATAVVHRNLQLGQQHIAVGDDRARSWPRLSVKRPFAPGATTMVFSAPESTTMIAVPLGPGISIGPVQPNAVGQQVSPQLLGGSVVADRADELHLRTRARRRHRLIAALAAGCDASTTTPAPSRPDAEGRSTSKVRSMFTLPTTQTRAIPPTLVRGDVQAHERHQRLS